MTERVSRCWGRSRSSSAWWVCLLVMLPAWVGCSEAPLEPPEIDERELIGPRIVSTSPAISQALIDMGLGSRIVGRNDFDQTLPDHVPVVGSFATGRLEVRTEAFLDVKPTHVFVEGQIPSNLQSLAASPEASFRLKAFESPRTIEQLSNLLYYLPPDPGVESRSLGGVLGVETRAILSKTFLLRRRSDLQEITRNMPDPRPRVLMVIGLEGPMVMGVGTMHDEVLTRWLGAVNAVTAPGRFFTEVETGQPDGANDNDAAGRVETDDAGRVQLRRSITGPAPVLSRELLAATQADVILLFLDDRRPLGPIGEDPRLALFRNLPIPAVQDERIYLIDDPLSRLPSTSITRIAGLMGQAIYPQLAYEIERLPASPEDLIGPPPGTETLDEPEDSPVGDVVVPDGLE